MKTKLIISVLNEVYATGNYDHFQSYASGDGSLTDDTAFLRVVQGLSAKDKAIVDKASYFVFFKDRVEVSMKKVSARPDLIVKVKARPKKGKPQVVGSSAPKKGSPAARVRSLLSRFDR